MKEMSNHDYTKVVRLLKSFADTPCDTTKGVNERRQARLLVKKMQKRDKKPDFGCLRP